MIETDRRITAAGPRIFMQAAKSFDVLILGGGPGGAAAAITLARQGVAVAVIERSSGSGWRCGEILSPEGIGCLRRLRAFDEFVTGPHIPCPGVVTVWENAEAQMQDAIWSPQGRSWVLDRREFDASLANSARQAGACWIDAAAPTVLRRCSQQRWALTIKQRGVNQTLSGRLLIDSTGRAAWGARRLGIERVATDQLTALLAICSSTVTDQRLLLEATTDGWWYCIRLPTGRLLAACMTDADMLPRGSLPIQEHWRMQLNAAPWTRAACQRNEHVPVKVVSAATSRLARFAGPNWLAVGDSAFARDPLSSSGIASSLESGVKGALAALEALSGRARPFADYTNWLEAEYHSFRTLQRQYYSVVERWPGAEFWSRRRAGSLGRLGATQ